MILSKIQPVNWKISLLIREFVVVVYNVECIKTAGTSITIGPSFVKFRPIWYVCVPLNFLIMKG